MEMESAGIVKQDQNILDLLMDQGRSSLAARSCGANPRFSSVAGTFGKYLDVCMGMYPAHRGAGWSVKSTIPRLAVENTSQLCLIYS
jgi:hypothetical protein